MKTITFYSYKGGVGRTLLLANVAKYLCKFGQRVFALDFDLEAPGLHYKLPAPGSQGDADSQPGIVDYVHSFVVSGTRADSLSGYVTEITRAGDTSGSIHLMRAGKAPSADYWNKLAAINWQNLFYAQGAQGIPFFLDLKARIEKEYAADYLLIDSRTGITEIGGIATAVMPDTIVCLVLNTPENLDGAREVLRSIERTRRKRSQPSVQILPVLARLSPSDDTPEASLTHSIKCSLNKEAPLIEDTLNVNEVLVLHREPILECRESVLIGSGDGASSPLFRDYIRLTSRIVPTEVLAPHIVPFVNRAMNQAWEDPDGAEQDLVALCEHASIPMPHQALVRFYLTTKASTAKTLQAATRYWQMTGVADDPFLMKIVRVALAQKKSPSAHLEFLHAVWMKSDPIDTSLGLQIASIALENKRPNLASEIVARVQELNPPTEISEVIKCIDVARRSNSRQVMADLLSDEHVGLTTDPELGFRFRRAWARAARRLGKPYTTRFLENDLRLPMDIPTFVVVYSLAEGEGMATREWIASGLHRIVASSFAEADDASSAKFVEILHKSELEPQWVRLLRVKLGGSGMQQWQLFKDQLEIRHGS